MQRLLRLLMKIETAVAGMAIMAIVLCVIWGVLTRYVTEQPAVWTAELSGLLFTWIVFLGAAASFHTDQHIRVTLLVDKLPERMQWIVKLIVQILLISFLLCAAWLSYVMMLKGGTRPSPVLRIPLSYVYLAPLIAFSLMALNALLQLLGFVVPVEADDEPSESLP